MKLLKTTTWNTQTDRKKTANLWNLNKKSSKKWKSASTKNGLKKSNLIQRPSITRSKPWTSSNNKSQNCNGWTRNSRKPNGIEWSPCSIRKPKNLRNSKNSKEPNHRRANKLKPPGKTQPCSTITKTMRIIAIWQITISMLQLQHQLHLLLVMLVMLNCKPTRWTRAMVLIARLVAINNSFKTIKIHLMLPEKPCWVWKDKLQWAVSVASKSQSMSAVLPNSRNKPHYCRSLKKAPCHQTVLVKMKDKNLSSKKLEIDFTSIQKLIVH